MALPIAGVTPAAVLGASLAARRRAALPRAAGARPKNSQPLSQARRHGTFQSATPAILTTDESQTIVMANPASARRLRGLPTGLAGAPLEHFIPERCRARHRLQMQAFAPPPQTSRQLRAEQALRAGPLAQRCGVACRFEADGPDDDTQTVAPAVATGLYRIAQETLNQVARHAGVNSVQVRLSAPAWAGAGAAHGPYGLLLTVTDNGRGIAMADRRKPDGCGLLGMRERVSALGGAFSLRSEAGAGSTIEAHVPLNENAAAAGGS